MNDNVITIYEDITLEAKLYDDLCAVLAKDEYADLMLWSLIGVLDILKMNLGSGVV